MDSNPEAKNHFKNCKSSWLLAFLPSQNVIKVSILSWEKIKQWKNNLEVV
jgi:hypothetical protein